MESRELRIGNYYDNNGQVMQVTPNTIEEVWIAERNWCKPIPLTEECLMKFGFEKSDEWYFLDRYCASFDTDYPLWFGQQGCCQYDAIKVGIKYVHQLQNLYFALTQKELVYEKTV
jgi:hypothetical protein